MYAEIQLVRTLAARMDGAKPTANGSFTFWCPFCQVDRKDRRKGRKASLHPVYGFACWRASCESHGCSRTGMGGIGLHRYCKEFHPDLYREYVIESFKEGFRFNRASFGR